MPYFWKRFTLVHTASSPLSFNFFCYQKKHGVRKERVGEETAWQLSRFYPMVEVCLSCHLVSRRNRRLGRIYWVLWFGYEMQLLEYWRLLINLLGKPGERTCVLWCILLTWIFSACSFGGFLSLWGGYIVIVKLQCYPRFRCSTWIKYIRVTHFILNCMVWIESCKKVVTNWGIN